MSKKFFEHKIKYKLICNTSLKRTKIQKIQLKTQKSKKKKKLLDYVAR